MFAGAIYRPSRCSLANHSRVRFSRSMITAIRCAGTALLLRICAQLSTKFARNIGELADECLVNSDGE
jgi:hypothetical protein